MRKGYMTANEAAAHLDIHRQTLYNLRGTPDFPEPIYVGRTPLWKVADLDRWRAKHPARRKAGNRP